MSRYKVLVGSRSFGRGCPEVVDLLTQAGCQVIPNDVGRAYTEDELIARIPGIDAFITGVDPITACVLDAADRLRVISKHGVGVDNVDLAAAAARGIAVGVAAGTIQDSVADLTLGLMLALARRIPQADASLKAGQWKRHLGTELRGKVLGIVGLGRVGKGVCRRAKGFGVEVITTDVYHDTAFAEQWGVEFVELDELLARADFVSLHAPLSDSTWALIGAPELVRMKPTAYLINTARGGLVDEEALAEALQAGKLAGAAADVFVQEPPGDHPLLWLNNFIATSHVGGYTAEGLRRMGEVTAENVIRVLRGQRPLYEATLQGVANTAYVDTTGGD